MNRPQRATNPTPAPAVLDNAHRPASRRCPCCMSTVQSWRPIVYGVVDRAVLEQARRGLVVLGGLNHGRNEPRWQCTRCEHRFGRPRNEHDRFGKPLASIVQKPENMGDPRPVPAWRLMKTMPVRIDAAA